MAETTLRDYDEVPYESRPTRQAHPNRMAAVAALFGMKPAPVERSRVLELACGNGGNLIPMAVAYPDSRFVGIDLSRRQVIDGRTVIHELELKNITIGQMNILAVDERLGQFDYIIAHGLYSWVPPAVQDKVMDICAKHLSPQGVAYISYNTFPGWHHRGMLRDMLWFHAASATEPLARVRAAREMADFLTKNAARFEGPYAAALRGEMDALGKFPDWYVLHEHLAPHNQPIYFHEFVSRAAAKGLQFIGEAQGSPTGAANIPPELDEAIRRFGVDLIRREQYIDFVTDRSFRRTLLCKTDVQLHRIPRGEDIASLYVASQLEPAAPVLDYRAPQPQRFKSAKGVEVTGSDPMIKSALFYLGTLYPRSIRFDELCGIARQRLGPPPPGANTAAQDAALAKCVLDCYVAEVMDLNAAADAFTMEISERPVASPIARRQARDGLFVANLRHEYVQVDEASRVLLQQLDGAHDRRALAAALQAGYRPGPGPAPPSLRPGAPLTPETFARATDEVLVAVARTALVCK